MSIDAHIIASRLQAAADLARERDGGLALARLLHESAAVLIAQADELAWLRTYADAVIEGQS